MRRARFYLLSLTWGLPLTLCGLTLAAVLRGLGYRSVDYYGARLYTLGHGWGGLSLGPILITCSDASDRLRRHELGHAVQNCRYGPFILPPVLLSILRYHLRNLGGYYKILSDFLFKRKPELCAKCFYC